MKDLRFDLIKFNQNVYDDALSNKVFGEAFPNGGFSLTDRELDQLEIGGVIKKLVSQVPVLQGGIFNREIPARNGYLVWVSDYIGRYVINITRSKDNFYLDVAVRYEGDVYEKPIKTGYYFISTNGSIDDVRDAIDSTYDYW